MTGRPVSVVRADWERWRASPVTSGVDYDALRDALVHDVPALLDEIAARQRAETFHFDRANRLSASGRSDGALIARPVPRRTTGGILNLGGDQVRRPVHSFDSPVDSRDRTHVMDDLAICWCKPTVYQRAGERDVEIRHHSAGVTP